MWRIGILGASGYAGREAVRLVTRHPSFQLAFATAESAAGEPLRSLERLAPEGELLRLADAPLSECDAVLSCLPHSTSGEWARRAHEAGARVVDLSADLRVAHLGPDWARGAVYGLPELHRERIAGAALVANPGCYATAVLLALKPALERGLVEDLAVVHAASGVTGAGRGAKRELLFGEVAGDFRAYSPENTHRHLDEMRDQMAALTAEGGVPDLVFVPHLLPVRRGILATVHLRLAERVARPAALWEEAYAAEPFVDVLPGRMPSLHDVANTNRVAVGVCDVAGVRHPSLTVVAAIDNLLKGAAGQAVQNLNLMFGLEETLGLPC